MSARRRILVTAALPYANGPIHLGHLVEYLQTDIWCRFQRMRGHECYYVCADDAHGTPIMLQAQKLGIEPQTLIDEMNASHQRDFGEFLIHFDNYYSTHSPENRALANRIYEALRDGGHTARRTIRQAYDEKAGMFLPDRFIRGTCPKCKTPDQYGDSCESCGATYSPSELIDPISVVSGQPPIERDSEHIFVKLGDFEEMLRTWTKGGHLQPEVANKLDEWFEAGLQDWDVSRDAPYWGFEIPDAPGKYFYVWLDAPIGYMASFQKLCEREGLRFDDFWAKGSDNEVYHFIGKDITYFHCLFWPAMLHGAGFRTPTAVYCHGFLTVNGTKMSKSRGTFVMARTYLDHLEPEYLRYYYAAKLGPGVDDIDLSLEDFVMRVNSDLVGKLVNIASRCAGFISKRFDGKLGRALAEPGLYEELASASERIAALYEGRDYGKAMREIMALADKANAYIDDKKPWVLAKSEDTLAEVQDVCTMGLNLYRALIAYLKPVLPGVAERSEAFLQIPPLSWDAPATPLLDHVIGTFQPLMNRVDKDRVEAMIEASKPAEAETDAKKAPETAKAKKDNKDKKAAKTEQPAGAIQYDDFAKVELRVGKIVEANPVEGADKLLALTVELGQGDRRNIFAGIKEAYPDPAVLVGKLTVVVANLAPRKMRFGVSEGMVLAAGPGGSEIYLLSPDAGASVGMEVK